MDLLVVAHAELEVAVFDPHLGFEVWGLELRVWGLGLRV